MRHHAAGNGASVGSTVGSMQPARRAPLASLPCPRIASAQSFFPGRAVCFSRYSRYIGGSRSN